MTNRDARESAFDVDVVFLVADTNMASTVRGLLTRRESLGIRHVSFEIIVHDHHDSGCYRTSTDLLRQYLRFAGFAIVMFDRDGCGGGHHSRAELEQEVESDLCANGWDDRASVIVIDPELEAWVWSNSPEVDRALGWRNRNTKLRQWLRKKCLLQEGESKPDDPKKAVETVLKETEKPRSGALYEQLAEHVSLNRCNDPAFRKLKSTLKKWFPAE